MKEATQKSFAALVKYCEEARCRHAVIAEFFGDPLPVVGCHVIIMCGRW